MCVYCVLTVEHILCTCVLAYHMKQYFPTVNFHTYRIAFSKMLYC